MDSPGIVPQDPSEWLMLYYMDNPGIVPRILRTSWLVLYYIDSPGIVPQNLCVHKGEGLGGVVGDIVQSRMYTVHTK